MDGDEIPIVPQSPGKEDYKIPDLPYKTGTPARTREDSTPPYTVNEDADKGPRVPKFKHNNPKQLFELFLLSPGEKKIEERPVAAMANTSDFFILKEDHTMGNLLAEHLKMHPKVMMAGYKIPHPNVPEMFVRVQTNGEIAPKDAMTSVLKDLLRQFSHLSQEFTREFELRRVLEARRNEGGQGDGRN